jgi:hypothetical protein
VKASRTLLAAAGILLFTALVAGILALLVAKVITFAHALLMLVALLGLYLGFGVLIAAWRFVAKLE